MDNDVIERIDDLLTQAQWPSPWLKLKEAPKYANVDPGTFKKWRHQGLISVHTIDGVKRVNRKDIDKLYMEHTY